MSSEPQLPHINDAEDFQRYIDTDLGYLFRHAVGSSVSLGFDSKKPKEGHFRVYIEVEINPNQPCDISVVLDSNLDFEKQSAFITVYAIFHDDPEKPISIAQRKEILNELRKRLGQPTSNFVIADQEQGDILASYKENPLRIREAYGWSVRFPVVAMDLVKNIRELVSE